MRPLLFTGVSHESQNVLPLRISMKVPEPSTNTVCESMIYAFAKKNRQRLNTTTCTRFPHLITVVGMVWGKHEEDGTPVKCLSLIHI